LNDERAKEGTGDAEWKGSEGTAEKRRGNHVRKVAKPMNLEITGRNK